MGGGTIYERSETYGFIGIGGVGCTIVASISDKFEESLRSYAGFIGIDSDYIDLSSIERKKHDIKLIQLGDYNQIRDYFDRYPETESWFPQSFVFLSHKAH